jgi:hypothetical protein
LIRRADLSPRGEGGRDNSSLRALSLKGAICVSRGRKSLRRNRKTGFMVEQSARRAM